MKKERNYLAITPYHDLRAVIERLNLIIEQKLKRLFGIARQSKTKQFYGIHELGKFVECETKILFRIA